MVRAYAWRMIVERLLRILISAIRKRGFSGFGKGGLSITRISRDSLSSSEWCWLERTAQKAGPHAKE